MGEHPTIAAQKLVLQTVIPKRTCPPEDLLLHRQEDRMVQKHVQSCVFCRERLEMGQEHPELSDITSAIAGCDERKGETDREPAPGQIWTLKSHLAGWGPEAAYFNPPLVLIVSLPPAPIQAVRVAQIFHEPDLAGPGDVYLSPEKGLAQAWNVYTLAAADLESCRGTVEDESLNDIVTQTGQSHIDPEPHSVLQAFRELELKTAYIMASRSLFSALAAENSTENISPEIELLASDDPDSVRRQIQAAHPELILPSDPNLSAKALLGLAYWDNLPLAAADADEEITINCLWLDYEQEVHLCPGRAVITVLDHSEHGLFIAGRITEARIEPKAMYAWWVDGSESYAAYQVELSPDGSYFQLSFAHPTSADCSQGELKILLLGWKK